MPERKPLGLMSGIIKLLESQFSVCRISPSTAVVFELLVEFVCGSHEALLEFYMASCVAIFGLMRSLTGH